MDLPPSPFPSSLFILPFSPVAIPFFRPFCRLQQLPPPLGHISLPSSQELNPFRRPNGGKENTCGIGHLGGNPALIGPIHALAPKEMETIAPKRRTLPCPFLLSQMQVRPTHTYGVYLTRFFLFFFTRNFLNSG